MARPRGSALDSFGVAIGFYPRDLRNRISPEPERLRGALPNSMPHVVIEFQENRTPDNLLQDPVLISRGPGIVNGRGWPDYPADD
jgi:hypothetical protein